jgi:hypothetical protein
MSSMLCDVRPRFRFGSLCVTAALMAASIAGCVDAPVNAPDEADVTEQVAPADEVSSAICNPLRWVSSSTCVDEQFLFDSAANICRSCRQRLSVANFSGHCPPRKWTVVTFSCKF